MDKVIIVDSAQPHAISSNQTSYGKLQKDIQQNQLKCTLLGNEEPDSWAQQDVNTIINKMLGRMGKEIELSSVALAQMMCKQKALPVYGPNSDESVFNPDDLSTFKHKISAVAARMSVPSAFLGENETPQPSSLDKLYNLSPFVKLGTYYTLTMYKDLASSHTTIPDSALDGFYTARNQLLNSLGLSTIRFEPKDFYNSVLSVDYASDPIYYQAPNRIPLQSEPILMVGDVVYPESQISIKRVYLSDVRQVALGEHMIMKAMYQSTLHPTEEFTRANLDALHFMCSWLARKCYETGEKPEKIRFDRTEMMKLPGNCNFATNFGKVNTRSNLTPKFFIFCVTKTDNEVVEKPKEKDSTIRSLTTLIDDTNYFNNLFLKEVKIAAYSGAYSNSISDTDGIKLLGSILMSLILTEVPNYTLLNSYLFGAINVHLNKLMSYFSNTNRCTLYLFYIDKQSRLPGVTRVNSELIVEPYQLFASLSLKDMQWVSRNINQQFLLIQPSPKAPAVLQAGQDSIVIVTPHADAKHKKQLAAQKQMDRLIDASVDMALDKIQHASAPAPSVVVTLDDKVALPTTSRSQAPMPIASTPKASATQPKPKPKRLVSLLNKKIEAPEDSSLVGPVEDSGLVGPLDWPPHLSVNDDLLAPADVMNFLVPYNQYKGEEVYAPADKKIKIDNKNT